ncbi:hypothetical protein [Pseudonocardia humida]|uniref:Uncharacterized protein n=1 Tax=Pseudonocardia humida TaxID=2800819 RepID=A0ABT1A7F4_9PSEU|nr:hypothetical protein [Pseudonocardia humida]MCO1658895.1 hypothetical protein [Pseudonocardia humida]
MASRDRSLDGLLATWQAWSTRSMFTRLAEKAEREGNDEQAAILRGVVDGEPEVGPLEALTAQHELSSLLNLWEWQTVRAAREDGATWGQIGKATHAGPDRARREFLDTVESQHRYGYLSDRDTDARRAAAGQWTDELHADTPPQARAEIEQATAAGDHDRLDALRATWWNPDHRADASADGGTALDPLDDARDRVAVAQAAVGETAEQDQAGVDDQADEAAAGCEG